jgi:hypothetical protein
MADKTYIEICKDSKATIQINMWRKTTGTPVNPSGAYYTVKGAEKDNIIVPRSPARNFNNEVWATITNTVTASAALYDVYWEIHRVDGDITNHCTKVLVIDTC